MALRRVNVDRNLKNADWIKKVRKGKAQEEDLEAHDDALKRHEEENETEM